MLMWLRAGLTLLATVLFLIISIPVYLILWIVGKFSQETKDIASLRFIQGGLHFVWFFTGCKLTVIGRENIPKDQAVLYIGNHRSIFDAVITIMQLPPSQDIWPRSSFPRSRSCGSGHTISTCSSWTETTSDRDCRSS